jgi:hypothetical protein
MTSNRSGHSRMKIDLLFFEGNLDLSSNVATFVSQARLSIYRLSQTRKRIMLSSLKETCSPAFPTSKRHVSKL